MSVELQGTDWFSAENRGSPVSVADTGNLQDKSGEDFSGIGIAERTETRAGRSSDLTSPR